MGNALGKKRKPSAPSVKQSEPAETQSVIKSPAVQSQQKQIRTTTNKRKRNKSKRTSLPNRNAIADSCQPQTSQRDGQPPRRRHQVAHKKTKRANERSSNSVRSAPSDEHIQVEELKKVAAPPTAAIKAPSKRSTPKEKQLGLHKKRRPSPDKSAAILPSESTATTCSSGAVTTCSSGAVTTCSSERKSPILVSTAPQEIHLKMHMPQKQKAIKKQTEKQIGQTRAKVSDREAKQKGKKLLFAKTSTPKKPPVGAVKSGLGAQQVSIFAAEEAKEKRQKAKLAIAAKAKTKGDKAKDKKLGVAVPPRKGRTTTSKTAESSGVGEAQNTLAKMPFELEMAAEVAIEVQLDRTQPISVASKKEKTAKQLVEIVHKEEDILGDGGEFESSSPSSSDSDLLQSDATELQVHSEVLDVSHKSVIEHFDEREENITKNTKEG